MQLTVRALVGLAVLHARRFARRLAPLARRQARIGRRLGRLTELGLKPRQPLLQLRVLGDQVLHPLDQRQDQRVLRRAVEKLEVGRLNHPSFDLSHNKPDSGIPRRRPESIGRRGLSNYDIFAHNLRRVSIFLFFRP